MVGRPSSGRCEVCRKRKIKCDRKIPSCSQCIKSGWPCPGYEQKWEFRDGFVNTNSSHARDSPATETQSSRSSTPSTNTTTGYAALQRRSSLLPVVISNQVELLRTEFSWRIKDRSCAARMTLIPWEPYLQLMVPHVGSSPALDDAIACTLVSPKAAATDTVIGALAYGKALNSLQTALANPLTRFRPETMGAILLLQMYEQFCVRTPKAGENAHAKGLIQFIQLAGPKSFTQEFPRAIMTAELGNMVMGCVLAKCDCFIAEPDWLDVLALDLPADSTLRILQKLAVHGAMFPSLLRRYDSIRKIFQSPPLEDTPSEILSASDDDLSDIPLLMDDLEILQNKMGLWLQHESANDLIMAKESWDTPKPRVDANGYGLWLAFLNVARTFIILSHYMSEQVRWMVALVRETVDLEDIKQLPLRETEALTECQNLGISIKTDRSQLELISPFQAATLAYGVALMVHAVVAPESPISTVSAKIKAMLLDIYPFIPYKQD